MSQIHASISIFALGYVLTACVKFKILNERQAGACTRVRQTDHKGRQLKGYSAEKISIVLKYLLLKVKLRLKSQNAVQVFYESRNCKGINIMN